MTAFLAVVFMTTSMALAVLGGSGASRRSILEQGTPGEGTNASSSVDAVQVPVPPPPQEAPATVPAPPAATEQ